VGYLPGYLGCYPYYGTVVYGTGYRYRPWHGRRHYYPRPFTWGFHPRYNPWLSRWSFGYSFGSGFLRTGVRWRSGPTLEHPHGPPRWFGPGGYRRPLLSTDLTLLRSRRPSSSPVRPVDTPPMNLYRRSTNVGRVDRTASRLPLRPISPSPIHTVKRPNNVFAGRDGKVYQRDVRGTWKVNEGRAWKPTRIPDRSPAKPPTQGFGAPGFGTVRNWPPTQPQPQPQPRPQPVAPGELGEPQPQRPAAPQPRPVAPEISPEPGNLESEYRARERGAAQPAPGAARPAAKPQPAQQPDKPQRNPSQRKP
jgi:hypothetical protein